MTAFEVIPDALALVSRPETLGFLLIGTLFGLVIGLLPGVGGIVGLSLILPFLFGMDPVNGMALMVGAIAVTSTSDTFASVLLGIPGSVGSQATILDGYPLAQQGQAKRALSAAFMASLFGGVIGALSLFSLAAVARPIVLAMASPELFMLGLFGLSMVALLSRGAPLPGVLMGLFGLLVGTVGAAPIDAVPRFTFGSFYLWDGIPFAVMAMGLFAVPELVDLLRKGDTIAEVGRLEGRRMDGFLDVVRHKWLVVRSSMVGTVVGLVPGLGGAVVDWIAYGAAKQSARDSEMFGKGDIRGVIAPEAANNSKDGGSLIPTLLFGIPGSAGMAVMLTGIAILGFNPGPAMVERDFDITVAIVLLLVGSNVIGTIICLYMGGWVARASLVKVHLLVPFLASLLVIASYQSTRSPLDLVVFIAIGLFGWLLKRLQWPRPPFLIGLALAAGIERTLMRSSTIYGWRWVLRPGVIIIGLITITFVVLAIRKKSEGIMDI